MDFLTHVVTTENTDEAKVYLNGMVFDANASHARAMDFVACCHAHQKWRFCAAMSNHVSALRQALSDCALGEGSETVVPVLLHSPRLQADILEEVAYNKHTTALDKWLPSIAFPNASKALVAAVERNRMDWVEELLPLSNPLHHNGLPVRLASAMKSTDIAQLLSPHYTLLQMEMAHAEMQRDNTDEERDLLKQLMEEKRALEQRQRLRAQVDISSATPSRPKSKL